MGERTSPLQMERRTLKGGLEVTFQPAPASAQTFSVTYVAPAGWSYDPPGAEGLAMVAARMAVGMPGGRSREELARELDRLGATLTSRTEPESAEITVWGPRDSSSTLLRIFADAVLRPKFDDDELDRVRRQLRERQLRQLVQPDLRAERDLLAGVFPRGHPYRTTGIGSPSSAARISVEKLTRFHRAHYPARGSVLAVTDRERTQSRVRTLEQMFPPAALVPDPALPKMPDSRQAPRRLDVSIPGQSQVAVRLGGPTESRSSPRYAELYLANEVLGGRPLLSRLFQRIREGQGLVYHASSELEAMRWGGYWEAAAGTDPATRDRVVRMMEREVERISTERVPARELERIRESALGSLPLDLETTESAHELAVDVAYHRLPGDFYRTWPARLRAIRPAALQRAAEVGLSPERAFVVTAGPPAR